MKISANGLKLVKAFESCMKAMGGGKYRAYLDPVGVLTIGWGHTNHHPPSINAATIWTQQQCDDALARDIAIFERAVERNVKVPLKQHEFDALVSFTYNCGEGNLQKSSLLRKVNAGDFHGAALEFPKWNKADGRVLNGLVRRRASEALLFQGIADVNYDGKPDEPMARRVDPPPRPKTAPENTTAGGIIVGGGAVVINQARQGASWETIIGIFIATVIVAVGAFFIISKIRGK